MNCHRYLNSFVQQNMVQIIVLLRRALIIENLLTGIEEYMRFMQWPTKTQLKAYLNQYMFGHTFGPVKGGTEIDRAYIQKPSRENTMIFV